MTVQDVQSTNYAFEPIVNNNMLWSTHSNTEKLGFVSANNRDIISGEQTIPSYDGSATDTFAENPINDNQSYFIEKYCALLSFPDTHPSNSINYGSDMDYINKSDEVKDKIINNSNDCSPNDTDCSNYHKYKSRTTNDWLGLYWE